MSVDAWNLLDKLTFKFQLFVAFLFFSFERDHMEVMTMKARDFSKAMGNKWKMALDLVITQTLFFHIQGA